jgi:hypothetical protein
MRRLGLGIALASAVLCVGLHAGPASAGGSALFPARDRYEPGQTATVVGYTGGGQLGWIEDGPFYAYLAVGPAGTEPDNSFAPSGLFLGQLVLQETGRGGYLSLRASVTFPIPSDLVPGQYGFSLCNDPCTTGLGDFIGGSVWVGVDPPQPLVRDWPADDPALAGAPASVALPAPAPTTTVVEPPTTPSVQTTNTTVSQPPAPDVEPQPSATARPRSAGAATPFPWLPIGVVAVAGVVLGVAAVLRGRRRVDPTAAPANPGILPAQSTGDDEARAPSARVPIGSGVRED